MRGDAAPERLPCPLRQAAIETGDEAALAGPGGPVSFGELDRRVSAAAGKLGERGVGEGMRVGVYLAKSEDYLIVLLALLRLGSVAAPLSTRLPAPAAAAQVEAFGCRYLLCAEGELDPIAGVPVLRPERVLAGGGAAEDTRPLLLPVRRPATVVATSGSTGPPRGALHTLGNHLYSALGVNAVLGLEPGDRWLHALPLYHVGGLAIVFRCLLARAQIALPEPGAGVGEAVHALAPTHVSLVATQLRRLLDAGEGPGNLKAILMGASAMPPALLDGAVRNGLPVHASYGLTEMSSAVTATRAGAPREELATSGGVLPHREVSISEEGEILVRGRTLFAGYAGPEGVTLPLDGEGWFHTGDLGTMDRSGRLLVRGRRDNMFVSGGENVQPEGVEEALGALGGVLDAVVVPVPDPEFGERPVAFVRTAGALRPEGLARELERHLPRFMVPVAFYPWPDEPSGGMKPDRLLFARRARRLYPGG